MSHVNWSSPQRLETRDARQEAKFAQHVRDGASRRTASVGVITVHPVGKGHKRRYTQRYANENPAKPHMVQSHVGLTEGLELIWKGPTL